MYRKQIITLVFVITALGCVLSKDYELIATAISLLLMTVYVVYLLFTNKPSLWSLVLLSFIIINVGAALKIMHWPDIEITLVSGVLLKLFIIPALIIEKKKKEVDLDMYLLGGFALVLLQSLSLVKGIETDGLHLLNYGVFGMFMTSYIDQKNYGKTLDGVVTLFLIQAGIFVINQTVGILF